MASFLKGLRRGGSSSKDDGAADALCGAELEDAEAPLEEGAFVIQSAEDKTRARAWSAANKNGLSKLDYPFSSEQLAAVATVRANCAAEIAASAGFEEVVSDRRIMRFVRGHKFDLEVASDMYRKMLQWRKAFGADAIRQRIVDEKLTPKDFPHAGRIFRYYPGQTHYCEDKEGRPVNVELIGRVQPRKLLSCFSAEEWVTHHVYCCEYNALHLDKLTVEQGSLARMILLYDLQGCGTQHLRTKSGWALVKSTLQITQDNYPETMHKTFLINVPKVFTLAWGLLKPILAERTVAKIEILGKDRTKLFAAVDKSQLPVSLGGMAADKWPLVFDKQLYSEMDDDHNVVEVGKGRKEAVQIEVPEDSFLVWGYYSKAGDIDATVTLTSGDADAGQVEAKAGEQDDDDAGVLANNVIGRSESCGGSVHVDQPSTFTLTFDNTFSWVTKKTIHYYVCVTGADDKHHIDSPKNGKLKSFFAD